MLRSRKALCAIGGLLTAYCTQGMATATPEEAARLGKALTPVGAIKAGNAEGSIPEWMGESLFTEEQKALTRNDLETWRTEDPKKFEDLIYDELRRREPELGNVIDPVFTITRENFEQYADKLTVGHKAMFEQYETYKMKIHPTMRSAFFPKEIYDATIRNATRARLNGTDDVDDAALGFPFPIPKQGAEVLWNHKLKYRGSTVKRFNNQAIVKPDGNFKISKLVEDVKFKYANLDEPGDSANKLLAYYFAEVIEPPRVAGQMILVHETADQGTSGRAAWIFNPGLGRVNRAPDVGYDNPSVGTDGEQFNDQVDVFNGALDRYNWKLIGRKEMYIPYHAYELNSPLHSYDDIIGPGHINQDLARYELHRVWIVEATVKDGLRHQFKKRVFYIDEDSWSIASVDCYDNRDELWKMQEAQLITLPFIPTVSGIPEIIYDLQSSRYFMTALTNEDEISDFEVTYEDKFFSPAHLKRKARTR